MATGSTAHGTAMADDMARYRPAVVQYFRRKAHSPSEIDDLVQEVFVRVAARRSGEEIANIGGYVFQTAASVFADRYRRDATRRAGDHVEFDVEAHAGSDFDPARILEGREMLRIAVAVLETLPERTRTIFVMRRLDGLAYKDIADRVGISVSAVEKHVARAIQALVASCGSLT